MGCCGVSICAVCSSCGGLCGTCTCASLSCAFCGGCLTGNPGPCASPCNPGYSCVKNLPCPTPGSNVDLSGAGATCPCPLSGNLPLAPSSGDPNLTGLSPGSGVTDNPPASTVAGSGGPRGGGSGGGSSGSSMGGSGTVPHSTQCSGVTKLTNALSRFGTTLASAFAGVENTKTGLQKKTINAITTPAFMIVIVIVGVALVILAWHGREG